MLLPSRFLEIRSSSGEHCNLWERPFFPWVANGCDEVTNRISYYDCTDYVDQIDGRQQSRGVLTNAHRAPALNLFAYIFLLVSYVAGPSRCGVDTHGGYFKGDTSKDWIYTLAFAGFSELLVSLLPASPSGSLRYGRELHEVAEKHQLQVLLSCREQKVYGKHLESVDSITTAQRPATETAYLLKNGQLFVLIDAVTTPFNGEWGVRRESDNVVLVLAGKATQYVASDQNEPMIFRRRPDGAD